uniref:NADH-ubiquinone oxidoreductase chain 3 n=1 Tax=Zancudomyces culisetae TaxID=1213189 RepID=Q3T4B6_ZANCU|nr:NADH dehydrogenase subunit 3 [Zancudomyces culisetae]AAW49498.1 NADH dehydrogenase subunit 3 [Zancudomyces culisetae]
MNSLIIFIILTPCILSLVLIINLLLPINKPDFSKLSPYECGMDIIGSAREKFNILFYLVAILFLIFDIEVIFLFPFATILYDISVYGYWIVFFFLIILTLGFIFELSKDILNF